MEGMLNIDLSLEFLMGRALDNAMLNVGMKDVAKGEILKNKAYSRGCKRARLPYGRYY